MVRCVTRLHKTKWNEVKIKILKSSYKSREHIQKKKHGQYFEISATQVSIVTLTISGDESHKNHTVISLVISVVI